MNVVPKPIPTSSDSSSGLLRSASRGTRSTIIGILASVVLAAVKILSGIAGNSYALIADGVESMLDILSSLVVLGSLRIAALPPNERFPYGYGKVEPLAAMAVAAALLVAAVGIAIQSVREILTPHHSPAPFTLVVLVLVVATKELMFRLLSGTGRQIKSDAMLTDAWHHRSDALTSLAAFIGISIALAAGEGYESADDWAALTACLVIVFNGMRLGRKALHGVLDAAPPADVEHRIRRISEAVEMVQEVETCNVRKSGLGYLVDLHVVVDGDLSVRDGHHIAHEVKDALRNTEIGVLDVIVHIEPSG